MRTENQLPSAICHLSFLQVGIRFAVLLSPLLVARHFLTYGFYVLALLPGGEHVSHTAVHHTLPVAHLLCLVARDEQVHTHIVVRYAYRPCGRRMYCVPGFGSQRRCSLKFPSVGFTSPMVPRMRFVPFKRSAFYRRATC